MANKRDFMYVILAVAVVLIIALVVKPAVTGEDPPLRWPGEPEPAPVTPIWTPDHIPTAPPTTTPAPTPTPVPTWDGKPKKIGFADPATYHISPREEQPNMTAPPPATAPSPTRWVTYATIDGKGSGTTGIIRVPFPLWRLDYSDITTTSNKIPFFNCQVMDAEDPNRFVHIVTLRSSEFMAMKGKSELREEQWVKTFYEGQKDYYFVINTQSIGSYHLKVQVPETYVGK